MTPEKEGVTLSMKAMSGLRVILLGLFPVYFHFFVLEKFFYRKKYAIYAALFIPTMAVYIYLFTLFSPFIFNEKADYYSSAAFIFFIVMIATSLKVIKRSISERFETLILPMMKAACALTSPVWIPRKVFSSIVTVQSAAPSRPSTTSQLPSARRTVQSDRLAPVIEQ